MEVDTALPTKGTARRWLLTYNNPPEDELFFAFMLSLESAGTVTYAKWQRELAPTTATEHMQMWVVMTKSVCMFTFLAV